MSHCILHARVHVWQAIMRIAGCSCESGTGVCLVWHVNFLQPLHFASLPNESNSFHTGLQV